MLPRIARSDPAAGFATEALTAAIAQGEEEAKKRLKAFLEKRATQGRARVRAMTAAGANDFRSRCARRCGRCGSERRK